MDDLTLIRGFGAEREEDDPRARAAAWRELEARFEAPSAPPTSAPRRGVLALAGVGLLAAVVAGLLILGSGPRTQPAAAEVLRQTATVAATAGAQAGPGQYYFTRTRTLEFEGWIPGGFVVQGAPITSRAGAFAATIPVDGELWISPLGSARVREVMGAPRFSSSAERRRWRQAGSPLPLGFDPRYEKAGDMAPGGRRVLELSRGVLDFETPRARSDSGSYPDLSGVPTDPERLRLAIRDRHVPGIASEPGKPLDTEESIAALGGLLSCPNASPALRAAAFDALAEMPGVELDRSATDLLGRKGFAIGFADKRGLRGEYIFDPETSMSLGERTVLADPGREPQWKGYRAGLTIRDVAYLQSRVVDSTREPAAGGRGGARPLSGGGAPPRSAGP